MKKEIPDDIYSEVTRLSSEGNALSNTGDFLGAVQKFEQALTLLPAPAEDWSAAMWLFTAIGDSFFLAGDYESARVALNRAQLFDDSLDQHNGISINRWHEIAHQLLDAS